MTDDLLENGVEFRYRGPATVGASGDVVLRDRSDGLSGMLWEGLEAAGWVGERTSSRMTVAIRVGVPARQALGPDSTPAGAPHSHHRGWIDHEGFVWQQYRGSLSGRAAGPGFRLIEGELTSIERGAGDAVLRSAAARAGWLESDCDEPVELPEVQIIVSVARRNPRWEDPDAHPLAPAAHEQTQHAGRLTDEELLAVAFEVAARFGDPNPVSVQHARGTRFDLNLATGAKVFSDTPSCMFLMEGNFRWNHSRPPHPDRPITEEDISYRFLRVVIDAETGRPMDHGASKEAPDLTALRNLLTDHPRASS